MNEPSLPWSLFCPRVVVANEAELVGENEDVDGEGDAPPPEPPRRGLPSLAPPLSNKQACSFLQLFSCEQHT